VEQVERGLWRHRVAFAAIGTAVLIILVLMPLAVSDAINDLLGPPEGRIFRLVSEAPPATPGVAYLHLTVVGLSELQQTVTLRVTGHYRCETGCAWSDRLVLLALQDDDGAGLPPAAAVTLTPGDLYVHENVELPARGHASRYPFDRYELMLGILLQRVLPDGTVQVLPPDQAAGQLSLTLQEGVARLVMTDPVPLDPAQFRGDQHLYEYLNPSVLRLERPLYLRILAVLLIVLIAAVSAYAVFMRPLHDLVLNAGALIIGVWGVRAMLVPMPWTWLTSIDLSLSVVIIFLLGAITVRALIFAYQHSHFHRPHRRSHAEAPPAGPPAAREGGQPR
jgi:hypothetical protein